MTAATVLSIAPAPESEHEKFLRVWFAAAGAGALLEVRSLQKRGRNAPRPQSWHRTPASAAKAIADSVRNGDDVYVGALPRTRESGTEDAVGARRFVWSDVDYGTVGHAKPAFYATRAEALDAVKRVAGELEARPTFLVDSGGGLHAWWALQESANDTDWREAIGRLNHALNGDLCATDLPRILRVPGTKNHKVDPPRLVRLLEVSECYTAIDRFLALPAMPEETQAPTLPTRTTATVDGPFSRANSVPVDEVLAWLGVPVHREGKRIYCACPVCPGNDEHEMVVGGRSNVASCFGDCADRGKGRSYSPVDLVAGAKKVEPRVAVQLLATQFRFDAFASVATPKPSEEWEAFVPLDESPRPVFPQGVLQGTLGRFAEELAIETQTPRDMASMLSLAAIATACARRFRVFGLRHSEPLSLFTVVVMRPGERKSAVISKVVKPFDEEERNDRARFEAEIAGVQATKKNKKGDDDGDDEEKEILPPLMLTLADATPEAVTQQICLQGGRIAIFTPEGGGLFDTMAGRYAGDKGAALEVYLQGHAGDNIKVNRVKREAEFITKPALSMGIATQPSTLNTLASRPELRGRGLVARFLFSVPRSNIGARAVEPPAMDPEVCREYEQLVRKLLSYSPRGAAAWEEPLENVLFLGDDARELYRSKAEEYEKRQGPDGDLAAMPEWSSKLLGAVLRIAALLHMAEHAHDEEPWSIPIDGTTLERAFFLSDEYLIPHARVAFSVMSDTPAIDTARRLLVWIKKNSLREFTAREAHRALSGKGAREDVIDPALDVLLSHECIRLAEAVGTEGRSKAGRPKGVKYHVHPKL